MMKNSNKGQSKGKGGGYIDEYVNTIYIYIYTHTLTLHMALTSLLVSSINSCSYYYMDDPYY